MVLFFSENKKDGIEIGSNFTIIVTDINNIFIKELLCEVCDISENKNFIVREKEPSYIGSIDNTEYYKTFRVLSSGIFSGFGFHIIKADDSEEYILIGHFEKMLTKKEVMPLIMADA